MQASTSIDRLEVGLERVEGLNVFDDLSFLVHGSRETNVIVNFFRSELRDLQTFSIFQYGVIDNLDDFYQ